MVWLSSFGGEWLVVVGSGGWLCGEEWLVVVVGLV